MTPAEKTRENRLRRLAYRQGYRVTKSRAWHDSPPRNGQSGYMLIRANNTIALGCEDTAFSASLDDVEHFLTQSPK